MSHKKSKHNKHKINRIMTDYVSKILMFLAAALIITIITLLIINKPVKYVIHNIESLQNMSVRDVVIEDDFNIDDKDDEAQLEYGDKMGVIICENTGLNADIYFGSNRKSMKNGVGFSNKTAPFAENKLSLICGYDETYFSSLKLIEEGDVIDIHTPQGDYKYVVSDMKYLNSKVKAYSSDNSDTLVLCSICSDLSNHKGEYFYVFAQKAYGGAE